MASAEPDYSIIVANCRGQMVYTDAPFKIQTIEDTLNELSPSDKRDFDAFLQTKVKYMSYAPPGVCGFGLDEDTTELLLSEKFNQADINLLLAKLREEEPGRDAWFESKGSPEPKYRRERGLPLWKEYPLKMTFPDKYLRVCPRKDWDDTREFSIHIDGELVELPNEYIMLSQLLLKQFRKDPTRPVFFPDACCSKLAKIKYIDGFPEIDDDTRLLNFTTPNEHNLALNDVFTKITGGRKTRRLKRKRKSKRI